MRDQISRITTGAAILLITLATGMAVAQSDAAPEAPPQKPMTYEELPSETPATFEPVTGAFDHVRREAMIPMRDGVKLFTVILVPKGAADEPILLTRTPYDADGLTRHKKSAHLGPVLSGYDNTAELAASTAPRATT
jgi:predicted acyl esterase